MRIVSFLPSATEIVFALGLGDNLFGVTHECDYPPEATHKPRLVNSFVETSNRASGEIDAAVRERFLSGQPLYDIDAQVLADARPDLVITQGLCDVCAIPSEQVNDAVSALSPAPQVISLDPHSLDDMLGDIQRVGDAAGASEKARSFVESLIARRDAVASRVSLAQTRPTVACLEWLDPILVAGHWVPEMVTIAGGEDCFGKPGEPSFKVEWPQVAQASPDVVLAMPCGFDVRRAISEVHHLTDQTDWPDLPAARQDKLFVLDGGSYYSRSGPRLIEGLEIIAEVLHPELFSGNVPQRAASRIYGSLFRVS